MKKKIFIILLLASPAFASWTTVLSTIWNSGTGQVIYNPTSTPTPTPTPTNTFTPTGSPTYTKTVTPTPTFTFTPTITNTPAFTGSVTVIAGILATPQVLHFNNGLLGN